MRTYLGTMTFGWSQSSSMVDTSIASTFVDRFVSWGGEHVDTARIYSGGTTEPIVAEACVPYLDSLLIGTKAHPSQPGGLSSQGILDQFQASMDALNMESVNEYYLHQPDPQSSLLDALRTADDLVRRGKVRVIGLSNYNAAEVKRAFELCETHKLTKPGVYQGLYNALNRQVEDELLPLLKSHGCAFIAYNPLAAGLLTGKHNRDGEVKSGRFRDNPNYLPRFYTAANFDAVDEIQTACENCGIPIVEAAYRWLYCHSALGGDDGVLVGASNLEQLDANLAACKDPRPLPEELARTMNGVYSKYTKPLAFSYFRSYSGDFPGRESLDQGASYSASKK